MRRAAYSVGPAVSALLAPILAATLTAVPALSSAMPPAIAAIEARRAATALYTGFALEGDATAVEYRYTEPGCRGFVAWSEGRGSDVDLSLHSAAGQLLADDHGAAGYGYVRLCGDQGLRVRLVAAAYAGQGELHVLALADAPEDAHALFAGTPLGVLSPGSAEGERDVGELSLAGPEGATAWGDDAVQRQLGYDPVAAPTWLPVGLTGAEHELELPARRCTRIDIQAPFQRGLLATVQLSSGELLHGQAPGKDRVSIHACTASDTRARVRVRPRVPRGLVGVRAYVHRLPVEPPAIHSQHGRLARGLEIAYAASAHGLSASRLEEVWLEPGMTVSRPLPELSPGCSAVMVLPDDGTEVDVRWVRDDGKLLALNEGRAVWPVLYQCAAAGPSSLRLRGRGRPGRVGVWVAREAGGS